MMYFIFKLYYKPMTLKSVFKINLYLLTTLTIEKNREVIFRSFKHAT